MIYLRRLIIPLLAVLTVLAGCQSTEDTVATRSLDQAQTNVVGLVDAVVAGATEPIGGQPPAKQGCLGQLGSYHGPPFRWEYSQRVEYTDNGAQHAKSVVDDMATKGWSLTVRERPQDQATNYGLTDSSGVILSVTIPASATPTTPNGAPNTIRVTGTSECAE